MRCARSIPPLPVTPRKQERLRHLDDALIAARRAVSLAQQRFERGVTDSLNVIDAQRQEYVLEQEYVSRRRRPPPSNSWRSIDRSAAVGKAINLLPPIPAPLPAIAAAFKRLWTPQAAP